MIYKCLPNYIWLIHKTQINISVNNNVYYIKWWQTYGRGKDFANKQVSFNCDKDLSIKNKTYHRGFYQVYAGWLFLIKDKKEILPRQSQLHVFISYFILRNSINTLKTRARRSFLNIIIVSAVCSFFHDFLV